MEYLTWLTNKGWCTRCGAKGHAAKECKETNVSCNKCSIRGHNTVVCAAKLPGSRNQSKAKATTASAASSDDEDDGEGTMHYVSKMARCKGSAGEHNPTPDLVL